MPNNPSVILLGTNISQTAPRVSRFKQFATKLLDNITSSNYSGILRLVPVYSNRAIIEELRQNNARMAVLHFDGRREHFAELLEASRSSALGDLPTYLGRLKKLRFVFLSGCATDNFANVLLNCGVPAVITSSHRLSVDEIELFADTVYTELITGKTIQDAFETARGSLGVETDRAQRIYVNLRCVPQARNWTLPIPKAPRIVGKIDNTPDKPSDEPDKSQNDKAKQEEDKQPDNLSSTGASDVDIAKQSTEPPPTQPQIPAAGRWRPPRNWNRPHPFVGNRPFSKDDGDIFFGRDDEVEDLSSLVRDKTEPPFIVLSGAAGCGKTSLLQAGLRVNLRDEFEVIELSSDSVPGMVTVLREELATKTGKEDPLEAWKTLEGNYDRVYNMTERRILLIVDNIDSILNSYHPRIHRELRQLLAALLPLYANTLFRSQSKIIISVRSFEAMDVNNILLDLALPAITMPLKPINQTGLRQAIAAPFRQASPGGHTLATDAADRIERDLLKDQTSVQLPFLQAILENLWTTTHQASAPGTQISLATYEAQHKSCRLFRGFLDAQLQQVQRRLNGEVDTYTLLRLLWHHSSPHHLSTQRSMQERYLQFPHIDNVTMEKALDAFCDHRLLLPLSPSKSGMLQIAHRELSPLVRERLIEMGTPKRSWIHRISANLSKPFTSFGTTKS